MLGMKYVVYDDDSFSIFPQIINHNDMRIMGKSPVSAGFLIIRKCEGERIDVSCGGESLSLGLKSNGKIDEEIIKVGFLISGMV